MIPRFVVITDGKRHNATAERHMDFPGRSFLTFDKGYKDVFADDIVVYVKLNLLNQLTLPASTGDQTMMECMPLDSKAVITYSDFQHRISLVSG